MKKLLSIVLLTLFFVGGVYAKSTVKVTVYLSSYSYDGDKPMGYVTCAESTTEPTSYNSKNKSADNFSFAGIMGYGKKSTKPYYIFANSADNSLYYFVGWSKDVDDPTKIVSAIPQDGYMVGGVYADGDDVTVDDVYYAHFAKITTWNITLKQVAQGGSYTARHNLNSGTIYEVTTTQGAVVPSFTNPDYAIFEFTATASTGSRFYRWCIDYGGGNIVYDNRPNASITIAQSATISCEFISKDYAQFTLLGQSSAYYKLSEAIAAADASSTSKVIVLKNSGKLFKETDDSDYYSVDDNKYTIPDGVTVLIPNSENSADYQVNMGQLTSSQITTSSFLEKMNLSVEDGQDFEVYGDICVYAHVVASTGAVRTYGRLHLGNNVTMTFKHGARLNVLGYITGSTTSSVIAESGSSVQEVIQLADYRGGSALLNVVTSKNNKVFPMSQYYVQNIEPKLILHSGAVEYITNYVAISSFSFPTLATLIAPSGGNYQAMFLLGDGAVLEKYYDVEFDRMKYTIRLREGASSASVYFDKIELVLDGGSDIAANIALAAIGGKISSADFVLPINNNMDVHICEGINVEVKNDVAFLAGSTLRLDKNASVTASTANVYFYDAEEHHVKYTDNTVNLSTYTCIKSHKDDKGNTVCDEYREDDVSIVKDNYYNYFGAGSLHVCKVPNRPKYNPNGSFFETGNFVYDRDKDFEVWSNSNNNSNTTKLSKVDAKFFLNGSFTGNIYTTNGGACITSDDKETNATITFTNPNSTRPTLKQVIQRGYQSKAGESTEQKVLFVDIPVNYSATLLNANGKFSAGTESEKDKTYTYYPLWDGGRWSDVLPQGEITPTNLEGNHLEVTLPIGKNFEVTFTPQVADTKIKTINKVVFSGSRFVADKEKEVKYEGGKVTIPIKYHSTLTHDDNISEDNPENVTISFNCTNTNSGRDEVVSLSIDLTATQNYRPKFKVNDLEDGSIPLNFESTSVWQTSKPQKIKVTPIEENVTDRKYNEGNGFVEWQILEEDESSSFRVEGDYFSNDGVSVIYAPVTTAGVANGVHTATITLIATYGDDVITQKIITLQGTPTLATNPLDVVGGQEIYPGEVVSSLFTQESYRESMLGNGNSISITFNGNAESEVIECVKEGNNYQLQVKDNVKIYERQEIVVRVSQEANAIAGRVDKEVKIIVIPSVQWNWAKLYFGNTYGTPVVVKNENTQWTLSYIEGCDNITFDNTKNEVSVSESGNECIAIFRFTQGTYSVDFTANVYADPRILDLCVTGENAKRTFDDISLKKTNVEYNDGGVVFATTETSGAEWSMQIIGVPSKMEFIPSGEGKSWTITQYGANAKQLKREVVFLENNVLNDYDLEPATQQILIGCSMGQEQGKITNLCVYRLDGSVTVNENKLYLPITRNEQNEVIESSIEVKLSYVSPESKLRLSVVDEDGDPVFNIELSGENLSDGELPKTEVEGENIYREETIIVSSDNTADEGIVYLLVQDEYDEQMLRLPICLYEYPQPLPLISSTWSGVDAEKYNFYKQQSANVQFNANTKELIFVESGQQQRYVTFKFRGGPSYISFESSLDYVEQDGVTLENAVLQEWYDYWTLEVSDGESYRSIAKSAEEDVKPTVTAKVLDGKIYYQLRVAIPYTTKSLSLINIKYSSTVVINNIVIDGNFDLDVVRDNHTIEHETVVNFSPITNENQNANKKDVVVTAINLEQLKIACNNPHFTVKYGEINIGSTPIEFTSNECPNVLGNYMVGDIALNVTWDGVNMVEEGVLIFSDKDNNVLATIRLLGAKDFILKGNSQETGLFTGFATNITSHPFEKEKEKYQYARRQVNLSNAFDEIGVALFDYLIVYGETTADDLGNTITTPTTTSGSNANTPVYIYRKAQNEGVYDRYEFVYEQANVNQGEKARLHEALDGVNKKIPHAEETNGTQYINIAKGEQLRVYMTGFCPYASTGFEKTQEGVWLFRGKKNAKLDIYLEDCHIYSRNKTEDGHTYNGKFDSGADIFQEDYAKGSGGVLVFECNQEGEYQESEAFQVTIHTRGNNLLKSNYGCFYQIMGARAYQVSSPVQIRLTSDIYYEENSKTHLTFDDKWPINAADFTKFKRTNGFLSLQKQANNAPSIDLGNGNTVVNFRGGQVELQNAQNVSDKYKTTLAISYRSGIMAAGGAEIQMAYGIGTDAATEGRVNFYDGTITVIPMEVDSKDRKYYLMDKDEQGNELSTTSCLRCPEKTYVYGGSICMLRACMSPTSQGGAPTDGVRQLGRFVYTAEHGYEYNTANKQQPTNRDDAAQWLVNPKKFPSDITLFEGLANYHQNEGKYTYGIESVTPNEAGELILWIPDGFGGVEAEQDRYLTAWKACMPQITAVLAEVGITTTIGGTVGGSTSVENIEDVTNLLYCQLDENVYDVISEHEKDVNGNETEGYAYKAPLKVPDGFKMDGVDLGIGDYMRLAPSFVGPQDGHEIKNNESYNINGKVYYISSAIADVWQTFTAPFDVENIWVVETYDEVALSQIEPTDEEKTAGTNKRKKILKTQATHNADFAAFFGVAMALGSEKDFDGIYNEYLEWAARIEDRHEGEMEDYTKRGMFALTPYVDGNWDEAHFYLYHNAKNWTITNATEGEFETAWKYVERQGEENKILLKKGETYSMLFPYCVGCDDDLDKRAEWDYWSGKFIIFESTQATKDNPHVMRGANYVAATRPIDGEWVFANDEELTEYSEVVVTGNSTFAHMTTSRSDVFTYSPTMNYEVFYPLEGEETIAPTTAFLYGNVPTPEGASVMSISRMGKIKYSTGDNNGDDTPTGGEHVPTVGGGSDIFVTSVAEGINIAVSEPQYVGVFSATGALLYSGWVETSVDVNLVVNGVYVVVGENNSVKVIY